MLKLMGTRTVPYAFSVSLSTLLGSPGPGSVDRCSARAAPENRGEVEVRGSAPKSLLTARAVPAPVVMALLPSTLATGSGTLFVPHVSSTSSGCSRGCWACPPANVQGAPPAPEPAAQEVP